jgi:two-component system, OmpR family, response regulator
MLKMKKTILVVDDDPHIREVVCFAMQKAHFEILEAENGQQALNEFYEKKPDLIILDIEMPEMDGTDVCKKIRQSQDTNSNTPIFFLSSHDEEYDRVLGLELGGDDYITKPFSPRELVARVKAIFRRMDTMASTEVDCASSFENNKILKQGLLSLDCSTRCVIWNGLDVVFTATEFSIVKTLLQHPGHVYSRNALMDQAYEQTVIVSDRTIDSHLRRIRNKFKAVKANPIETVHGVGYKLNDCEKIEL